MDEELQAEQAEAMTFLQPLLVPFHEGWHSAQSTYRAYDPKHTADHDDSAAASCVRCHMWTYVRNQIDGMPGVVLLNRRGLDLLNYFDHYVFRFDQGWMVRRRPGRGEALVQGGMMMLPARGDQGLDL